MEPPTGPEDNMSPAPPPAEREGRGRSDSSLMTHSDVTSAPDAPGRAHNNTAAALTTDRSNDRQRTGGGPQEALDQRVNQAVNTDKITALLEGLAASTRETYLRAWKQWLMFAKGHGVSPWLDPTQEGWDEPIMDFFMWEIKMMGMAISTVTGKYAAIKFFHTMAGRPDLETSSHRIRALIRALKRRNLTKRRAPFTVDMLDRVEEAFLTPRQEGVRSLYETGIWAALTAGFYYLLRISEIQDLTEQDVEVLTEDGEPKLRIWVKRSKTDQRGEGLSRTLAANRSPSCPVVAMSQHLVNMNWEPEGERYIFPPNLREKLGNVIKWAAHNLDEDPDMYNTHSLRAGGATALYTQGVQLGVIQRWGRWRSNAFHDYLWKDEQALAHLSKVISQASGITSRPHRHPSQPKGTHWGPTETRTYRAGGKSPPESHRYDADDHTGRSPEEQPGRGNTNERTSERDETHGATGKTDSQGAPTHSSAGGSTPRKRDISPGSNADWSSSETPSESSETTGESSTDLSLIRARNRMQYALQKVKREVKLEEEERKEPNALPRNERDKQDDSPEEKRQYIGVSLSSESEDSATRGRLRKIRRSRDQDGKGKSTNKRKTKPPTRDTRRDDRPGKQKEPRQPTKYMEDYDSAKSEESGWETPVSSEEERTMRTFLEKMTRKLDKASKERNRGDKGNQSHHPERETEKGTPKTRKGGIPVPPPPGAPQIGLKGPIQRKAAAPQGGKATRAHPVLTPRRAAAREEETRGRPRKTPVQPIAQTPGTSERSHGPLTWIRKLALRGLSLPQRGPALQAPRSKSTPAPRRSDLIPIKATPSTEERKKPLKAVGKGTATAADKGRRGWGGNERLEDVFSPAQLKFLERHQREHGGAPLVYPKRKPAASCPKAREGVLEPPQSKATNRLKRSQLDSNLQTKGPNETTAPDPTRTPTTRGASQSEGGGARRGAHTKGKRPPSDNDQPAEVTPRKRPNRSGNASRQDDGQGASSRPNSDRPRDSQSREAEDKQARGENQGRKGWRSDTSSNPQRTQPEARGQRKGNPYEQGTMETPDGKGNRPPQRRPGKRQGSMSTDELRQLMTQERAEEVRRAKQLWARLLNPTPNDPGDPEAGFSPDVVNLAQQGQLYLVRYEQMGRDAAVRANRDALRFQRWKNKDQHHLGPYEEYQKAKSEYQQAMELFRGKLPSGPSSGEPWIDPREL